MMVLHLRGPVSLNLCGSFEKKIFHVFFVLNISRLDIAEEAYNSVVFLDLRVNLERELWRIVVFGNGKTEGAVMGDAFQFPTFFNFV